MTSATEKRPSTDDSSSSSDDNITTTRKTNRSKFMKLLQGTTKPVMTRLPPPQKEYPPGAPQLDVPKSAKKHCDVHERKVDEIYLYDLIPKDASPNGHHNDHPLRKELFYFAGTSWRMPPQKVHWALCAELAKQLPDTRVSLISCPLAPKSPAPEAFPQLMKMYRTVLREAAAAGREVILAGDSSGGNQILCLAGNGVAQDPDAPAPVALVAICPSVDLRQSNFEQFEIEKHDPILRIMSSRDHADKWRGSWSSVDERVNPLYIDWEPMARKGVKVHGVVGGYDILRPDAIKLRDKLSHVGVKGEWLDWDEQMHGFTLTFAYGLEEGKESKDWIVDVISRT